MAAKRKRYAYVAVCPDCETWRNLRSTPMEGCWPECLDCNQMMNVYRRPTAQTSA